MTRKIYRTANGKMVDIGALQLQNENVRAVGNMGVNARGDLVDSRNKTINSRNQQVAKQYKRQINSNVSDQPVVTSRRAAQTVQTDPVVQKPAPVEAVQDTATESTNQGGLAAAIARARSIKQEPLAPATSRNGDGPVKI